jgi:hypothetical protein
MTQAEDKEAEFGRPITRSEEADLLRAFGHPLLVAARYGPGQYLVGPELYPLYIFALKVLMAIVAGSAVIAGAVRAVVEPGEPGPAITAALHVFWSGAVINVAVLTAIAAVIQHYDLRLKFLSSWNPEDLPRPHDRPAVRRQTVFDHVAGIVVQTLFALWWTQVLPVWLPYITYIPLAAGQRLDLSRAPIWETLFWPVLALALLSIAVHVLKLVGKADRPLVLILDLAGDLAGVVVASVALRAGHWVDVSGSGLPADTLAKIDFGVNIGLQVALAIVVIVAGCLAAYHVWRLYEHSRRSVQRAVS